MDAFKDLVDYVDDGIKIIYFEDIDYMINYQVSSLEKKDLDEYNEQDSADVDYVLKSTEKVSDKIDRIIFCQ